MDAFLELSPLTWVRQQLSTKPPPPPVTSQRAQTFVYTYIQIYLPPIEDVMQSKSKRLSAGGIAADQYSKQQQQWQPVTMLMNKVIGAGVKTGCQH